jgi:GTP-binding protein LepA
MNAERFQESVRNFCIVAHIDHGKSTLADRLLELTGTIEPRQMREQVLDRMELERERGITIKLQPVRMEHKGFVLNLIDTPGHVDFSYEVSRSLHACEGALLIVDATQGIQAQTLANLYLALAADLTVIPVINKIDLPAADTEKVSAEIVAVLGCDRKDILTVSAKTGEGVAAVLEAVTARIPPPSGKPDAPARALIFDSLYDTHRGVVLYVRLVDGRLAKGGAIRMIGSGASGAALEIGTLQPDSRPQPSLVAGEIGYVVTNLHSVHEARVGDTVTAAAHPATQALPGYQEVRPFVYAGLFPASSDRHADLQEALERLRLSDSALQLSPENSAVLGHGFRVGFLGLLHLDIVRERLEREYDLELIISNPSTDYRVLLANGQRVDVRSAAELPDPAQTGEVQEPWVKGEIVVPTAYVGAVIQLIVAARGRQKKVDYNEGDLAIIDFEAPLANLLTDFYDSLKSTTSGYGSFNYELADYRPGDLVRLDILVAGERVDSLSNIVHRSEALSKGRALVARLRDIIPRQLFEVSLQAAISGKIIAREDIKPLGKNVTGHLYGGDVSRKKKLWAKQKAGKARMKRFGKVDIPAEAFTALLKRD